MSRKTGIVTPPVAVNDTPRHLGVIALIFAFIFAVGGNQVVSAGGLNFFVWGDHILGTGSGNPPILMWGITGLFFGAMAGSVVIWRKYHIKFRWCLATIIPFLSLLFLLQAISDPLQIITPRPIVTAPDFLKVTPAVIPKRKRQNPARLAADTSARQIPVAPSCATQLGNVSIYTRTDSVNIYYRTANTQNGAWSTWRSKFVPQQGQFSLTDDGQVRANSLQYYYQAKSVWMRSAQDPFTLAICDKALVIDTY
jgi:hypothetical protein